MILGHDDNLLSPADQAHDEHQADLAQHDTWRDRLDDFAPSADHASRKGRMTDAHQLRDTMHKASIELLELVGMTYPGGTIPPSLSTDRLPLAAVRAAKIAADYLLIGADVLDSAIAGEEPYRYGSLDEELGALLGGEK